LYHGDGRKPLTWQGLSQATGVYQCISGDFGCWLLVVGFSSRNLTATKKQKVLYVKILRLTFASVRVIRGSISSSHWKEILT
jgi:hypothetical protein